jgi:hypothetical protein
MKIGVCIRAKNEQKIIADWVNHYLYLGFDKIVIYDNMSEPSIKETLTSKNITSNKVEVYIDNIVDLKNKKQSDIYADMVMNCKDYDWFLFCDTDEFLWLKEGTIKDHLSKYSEDTCSVVVNWLTYGMGNKKTYDYNKHIFEQFLIREQYGHFWNRFVKSFIRVKLFDNKTDIDNHISFNSLYKIKNIYNEIITSNGLNNSKPLCSSVLDTKISDDTPILLVHFMTLDLESMLSKSKRNKDYFLDMLLFKYTKKWYTDKKPGSGNFKDNVKDERMLKYVI